MKEETEFDLLNQLATQTGLSLPESQEERNSIPVQKRILRHALKYLKESSRSPDRHQELRSELIKIAAAILMTTKPPSTFIDDYEHRPKKFPVRWWREIYGKLIAAENERKAWAIRIRKVADSL